MPQIYRRYSEYVQRPPPEPRRRSSMAPQISDADDSIVLSDLVRTGEASRLRRRGAMRLDHAHTNAPRAPPPSNAPIQTPASGRIVINVSTSTTDPERVPTSPWGIAESPGEEDYNYSGEDWGDWNGEASRGESSASAMAMPLEETRREATPDDEPDGFMLFCGGVEEDTTPVLRGSGPAFEPSLLPIRPSPEGPHAHPRTGMRTNGCGALIHMRAFPQRPRGVWVGKKEATDAVVGLDAEYFERSVVAKMMKSACGCLREGIGCAVCGNTLGTRYLPCQAASEGIFSGHNSCSRREPSSPLVPSGPRYWRQSSPGSSHSSGSTRASAHFYVYTFFGSHVSSSPAYSFPQQSSQSDTLVGSGMETPQPVPPSSYGYRWTASPRPYSPYNLPTQIPGLSSSGSNIPFSPVFASPPLPMAPPTQYRRPASPRIGPSRPHELGVVIPEESTITRANRDVPETQNASRDNSEPAPGLAFDPDGVLVDADMLPEPDSPDKFGNEGSMLWPAR